MFQLSAAANLLLRDCVKINRKIAVAVCELAKHVLVAMAFAIMSPVV